MTHYLKTEKGELEIKVEMGCNHPNMTDNSTESVGCKGDCCCCKHSVATTTLPVMMELLNRAGCTWVR